MYAYPLCFLFFCTGQLGAENETVAPPPAQPYLPQTFAPPTLQRPGVSGTPTVASDPDRSAPRSFGLRSAFGEPEDDHTSAGSNSAPVTSALQNALTDATNGGPAAALMQAALRKPVESPIDGTPMSLRTILTGAPSAGQQSGAVDAYWRLSKSLAEYHFSLVEWNFFRDVSSPQMVYQRALLTAEEASAKARSAAALVAVMTAQHALAETAQLTNVGQLPLPSDAPFTGAYRTHFKVLNDQGAAPDHLASVDRALPMMRESIGAQAEAVLADESALNATQLAYQQGQATLADVLGIYHDVRNQRRAFLSSVFQYNDHIARYAFSVSLPGSNVDRIVGMLIETTDTERSVLASKRSDSNVRHVSNEEEVGGWSPASRETFAPPDGPVGNPEKTADGIHSANNSPWQPMTDD